MIPETHYARVGDLHIAYQTLGEGPIDIVLSEQWMSHVEAQWDVAPVAELRRRLAAFARVILFDKRGVGMSDPVALGSLPALETWMDDLRAVMDAVGSSEAVIVTTLAGAMMSLVFAATHPSRVRALVIADGFARLSEAADYPIGISADDVARITAQVEVSWGHGMMLDAFAPSVRGAPGLREAWARYERYSASPGTAQAMIDNIYRLDVRHVLPAIRVPTLILHHRDAIGIRPPLGRYLADNIPEARYVEFPGTDNLIWAGDQEPVVAEIEEFVTGARRPPVVDRMLATILITDIVESTRRAAELGDKVWRGLLERHDALVRGAIGDGSGRHIKSTGDGVLATFDGPGRAIRAARQIAEGASQLGLQVRAGLHAGEIEVSSSDVAGLAVHICSRVAGLAAGDQVLATSTVRDLVLGSGFDFNDHGSKVLRGVPGRWRIYELL